MRCKGYSWTANAKTLLGPDEGEDRLRDLAPIAEAVALGHEVQRRLAAAVLESGEHLVGLRGRRRIAFAAQQQPVGAIGGRDVQGGRPFGLIRRRACSPVAA